MNALIDNLKSRTGPKTPPPADLQIAVKSAEDDLEALQAEYGGLSLDSYAGVAGAEKALETLNKKLGAARDRVSTLKAAHDASVKREAEAIAAQRTSLQKTQLAALKKHLEARDAAAVALSAAIAEAAKQYHVLLDRSEKARAACPIGLSWPPATQCDSNVLRQLVAAETFRVSATAGDRDGRSLPGAQFPAIEYQYQPAAIPPLVDQVKQGTAFALTKLRLPE